MKKRQYIILTVILGLLILILAPMIMRNKGGAEKMNQRAKEVKYVKTEKANYRNFPLVIHGNGRVASSRKLVLIAEVQGKLTQGDVNLKAGTSFREGQLLFAIDDTEAALRVQSRKSNFLTMLAGALADLKIDFPEYFDAWENFFQQIDVTKPLPEMPKVESSKGKTYLASRNILGEYYGIRADEATLRKYKVYAPFDGNFMEVFAEIGAVVNPGSQIGRIIQSGDLEVEVAVEVNESQFLHVGDSAIMTTDKNSPSIPGRILRIGKYVNANTQSVDVFIGVDREVQVTLYDGMYVQVDIKAGKIENVMRLPRRAIFNQHMIYTVQHDTLLIHEPVEVAKFDRLSAYIRGVDKEEVVVVEPVSNGTDSMLVKSLPQDE